MKTFRSDKIRKYDIQPSLCVALLPSRSSAEIRRIHSVFPTSRGRAGDKEHWKIFRIESRRQQLLSSPRLAAAAVPLTSRGRRQQNGKFGFPSELPVAASGIRQSCEITRRCIVDMRYGAENGPFISLDASRGFPRNRFSWLPSVLPFTRRGTLHPVHPKWLRV